MRSSCPLWVGKLYKMPIMKPTRANTDQDLLCARLSSKYYTDTSYLGFYNNATR